MIDWLPKQVARLPVGIHTKLLASILSMVVMFVAVGAVGLLVLRVSDERATELVGLQQKIAAYRQLQNNTTEQLYALASAMNVSSKRSSANSICSPMTLTVLSTSPVKTRHSSSRYEATMRN